MVIMGIPDLIAPRRSNTLANLKLVFAPPANSSRAAERTMFRAAVRRKPNHGMPMRRGQVKRRGYGAGIGRPSPAATASRSEPVARSTAAKSQT